MEGGSNGKINRQNDEWRMEGRPDGWMVSADYTQATAGVMDGPRRPKWSQDGRADGRTDERTDRRTDRRMDGQADGRTGGWTDERTDGRTDGGTDG